MTVYLPLTSIAFMYTAMYTVEEDFLLRLLKSLDIISEYGTPGEIRTPDQLVRSQLLYPAELRARGVEDYICL